MTAVSAARGFRRLWVVVSALWIVFCLGAGAWLGYQRGYTNYCPKAGGECHRDYPPSYTDLMSFLDDKESIETAKQQPNERVKPQGGGGGLSNIEELERMRAARASMVRERWARWQETTEVVEVPARVNPRQPALGALVGVAGAALLYGVGSVVAWIVRGFRGA